jgi:hypothetical protein
MRNQNLEVRSQKSEINLHIDELVLHGFAPCEKNHIRDALEKELSRLFSAQSNFSNLSKSTLRDRVDGGNFRMANSATPNVVGAQIAGAVFGGINL